MENESLQKQIYTTKQVIRKSIAVMKNEISPEEKKKASEKVFLLLECCAEFQNAQVVLMYWSLPDELPTHEFIQKWSKTKKILLPKVEGNDLLITEYASPSDLIVGKYGILEPNASKPYMGKIDIAIIPGIAFDITGDRLGRGKGYYDRLLAEKDCLKIGVGFGFQLLEALPVSALDVRMQIIITPSNLVRCVEKDEAI